LFFNKVVGAMVGSWSADGGCEKQYGEIQHASVKDGKDILVTTFIIITVKLQ